MRINDVLKGKPSHDVITISPDATVRELVALLAEHNVGALIVSVDGGPSTGSSASATSSAACTSDEDVLDSPVSEIMTAEVRTCEPATDAVDELMQMMTEHRIRHVPV